MKDVDIRLLNDRDIEIIGDLYFPWSTREETIEKWKKYLNEQRSSSRVSCVIEKHEKVIGYGNLIYKSEYGHFRENNIPEISDIWIFEGNRRNGYASLLISHMESLAKESGYKKIGIGVGLYQDYGAAQRLYFKLGYKPDGEGITYKCETVTPGEKYPVDDDLILWLTKNL